MESKLNFLLNEYPAILRNLDPSKKAEWGKMNVHQMIEHMSDSVREANGKTPRTLLTPPERLQQSRDFLMSDKEFRPNTKNSMMGEEPLPVKHSSVEMSIEELEIELKDFQKHYASNPDSIIMNPFFGELDFNGWIQLLHKHAMHHLKQFGV